MSQIQSLPVGSVEGAGAPVVADAGAAAAQGSAALTVCELSLCGSSSCCSEWSDMNTTGRHRAFLLCGCASAS